ncbi:hypothetical protein OsJ_08205 [Oryza sativa Japonica Group]|uniref:Uncharacterized protein n=1 Tax=Oryza sativa subsp. japonica TaxID=39947 RepID=B9F2G7_ORYSJ|nr:hypothetical protein OsJ_08205 [Oryza sativa Japonica Group]
MAPSSKLAAALFFAFAVVAATLAPAAEARVQGFEPAIAVEKTSVSGGAQRPPTTLPGLLPGLPFPLFPFLMFPIPGSPAGAGGAPPSAGSGGFPFPLPFPVPLPGAWARRPLALRRRLGRRVSRSQCRPRSRSRRMARRPLALLRRPGRVSRSLCRSRSRNLARRRSRSQRSA